MTSPPKDGLGVIDASLLVVGSIVGAGIFLMSPYVALEVRSPAAFLGTWVLGGVVALSGALSNGELGGLFMRSGGEYVYLREAYGPLSGFLSGWTSFWIAFPGTIAALAAGFGAAVVGMLGLESPEAPTAIGVVAILALTGVNALGLSPGKWVLNALSGAKLAAFAALLGLGAVFGGRSAHGDASLFASGDSAAGIAVALVPVLFAYSGWNAATYVAGEMRDPGRGLGRSLALGTALCVLLYVAVNAAYLLAMPISDLARASDPARVTALRLGGPGAAIVLAPLVALCIFNSLQATVLVGPHLYRAMAVDGLFFDALGRTHPRTRVPLTALLVQAAVAIVELLSKKFDQLVNFVMFAIIAFSTLTVFAVFVLRKARPDAPRPFKVPGYPLVPAVFVVVNAWVLWNVLARGTKEALVGLAIVATGVPAYAVFRRRRP
ncbi:MAG TPA: amino acid permease [Polyangiaceae bacterium]|jgi:APA family basic amino acid/polyamine antiporter|nr:amino acid permease [Polyangiaceae bacterium]